MSFAGFFSTSDLIRFVSLQKYIAERMPTRRSHPSISRMLSVVTLIFAYSLASEASRDIAVQRLFLFVYYYYYQYEVRCPPARGPSSTLPSSRALFQLRERVALAGEFIDDVRGDVRRAAAERRAAAVQTLQGQGRRVLSTVTVLGGPRWACALPSWIGGAWRALGPPRTRAGPPFQHQR